MARTGHLSDGWLVVAQLGWVAEKKTTISHELLGQWHAPTAAAYVSLAVLHDGQS